MLSQSECDTLSSHTCLSPESQGQCPIGGLCLAPCSEPASQPRANVGLGECALLEKVHYSRCWEWCSPASQGGLPLPSFLHPKSCEEGCTRTTSSHRSMGPGNRSKTDAEAKRPSLASAPSYSSQYSFISNMGGILSSDSCVHLSMGLGHRIREKAKSIQKLSHQLTS